MRKILALTVCFLLILGVAGAIAGHGAKQPVKEGILLVAFGTSEPSAQVSFTHIEEKVREAFPQTPVYWAYTSHIIRHKLARQGKTLLSPAQALAKMMDEGFTHVAVQSLHTIPGEEFHNLKRTALAFNSMPDGFKQVVVGDPLLSTQGDLSQAVEAMLATIPTKRKTGEVVVLMGHGTHHPGNAYYSALNWQIQKRDPNVFVGTVEGYPGINDVVDYLKTKKAKSLWLMPFMSVAGDHAKNDMAGPEDESWISILKKQGFDCRTVMKGTAEYDAYVTIWIDHLRSAVSNLSEA